MRQDSNLLDLLSRWSAAAFLMRLSHGPLPAPEPDVFGRPSKAGSQLVWLGLAYRDRTAPPTYRISHRGKEAVNLIEEVARTLAPRAESSLLKGENNVAAATYDMLAILLHIKESEIVQK